ncbi:unnamed protein product [Boreogadus saida]
MNNITVTIIIIIILIMTIHVILILILIIIIIIIITIVKAEENRQQNVPGHFPAGQLSPHPDPSHTPDPGHFQGPLSRLRLTVLSPAWDRGTSGAPGGGLTPWCAPSAGGHTMELCMRASTRPARMTAFSTGSMHGGFSYLIWSLLGRRNTPCLGLSGGET